MVPALKIALKILASFGIVVGGFLLIAVLASVPHLLSLIFGEESIENYLSAGVVVGFVVLLTIATYEELFKKESK